MWVTGDAVNCFFKSNTDLYSIQRLSAYERNVTSNLVNVLFGFLRNSYRVSFSNRFLFSAHFLLASCKLMVGAFSASAIQALKAFRLIGAPGRDGLSIIAFSMILIWRFCSSERNDLSAT